MMNDFVLVMSAAVNPNGMTGVSAASLTNREDQYIDTLKFYVAQKCIPKILFVDNSNWDLSRMKAAINNDPKVEWISFDGNSFPREWGKGYGEFLLLDRAIEHISANGEKYMVKVTGRFPILNIETMIKEFQSRKNLQLAIDVVNHKLYSSLGLKWAQSGKARTIIYAVTCDFYKAHLLGHYKDIPSKFNGAEGLMNNVWNKTKNEIGVYPRFKHEPELAGCAGAINYAWITCNNYSGFGARCKRMIMRICRIILPNLWL